ncbi:MAG: hypothetical protein QM802_12390 [Agriterribacter sp.]
MKNKTIYLLKKIQQGNVIVFFFMCCVLTTLWPSQSFAGNEPEPTFEEILVFMNVQGVGSTQIQAAMRDQEAYLSVTEVFDFLKIKNTISSQADSIWGFYITQQAGYVIDKTHNRIQFQGKIFDLAENAFVKTATNLYLRSDIFGKVFGLQCKFSFRNLSVIVSSSQELPIMREMRQEAMRANLNKLKGQSEADTVIPRSYPMFKMGMADWSAIHSNEFSTGLNDTRLNLSLGGVVAGGETNISLNYRSNTPFNERQQYYQWRYVDNDKTMLRQVMAGKVFTPSISTLYAPVVGVQFTNAPSIYRRSFGTYTLSYFIEADWVAELYVNNTLVDYSKAEATGVATFQVPLVYGNSNVKIRFYSPWGEEKTSEQNIQIPFNFLPQHEFEYTASAGMVEDSLHSRFGRINTSYGVDGRLTVGGGVEYLSSVKTGAVMPYVNASFRMSANLLLAAEYTYGVRSKLVGSYHLPSDLQIEFNYTRYKQGQTAINNTFLEERKAVISYPFRSSKFTLFSRLSAYQVVLPTTKYSNAAKYTTVEGLLSGMAFGVNANFTTYALFNTGFNPYVYSSLSLTVRLPGKIIFTPQLQYEFTGNKLISARAEMGKYINSREFFSAFYENNFKSNFQNAGISFRYDFSFAVAGLSFTKGSRGSGAIVHSASGSLLYNDRTKRAIFNNRSSVGKGVITILPFLDMNGNGRRDAGEPKVSGVNVNINGGRIRYNKADSALQVSELEAYTAYTVTLFEAFENVAWHIRNKVMSVTVDPNQFKLVEVPVNVINEVSGTVYIKEGGNQKGLGRIIVNFYREDLLPVGEVMTEPDGSFNFSGLMPGKYTVQLNVAQIDKLHLKAEPASLLFNVTENKNGDFVDGLQFVLKPL